MQFLKKLNSLKKLNLREDKTLLFAFIALGVVVLLLELLSTPKSPQVPETTSSENFDVDTVIPAGYILIPIQLSNVESLASLAGQFALVDLYAVGEKGRKGFKVASSVKLLRAPLNPQQFAVLMREQESSKIVTMEGPFFAALKSRDDKSRSGLEQTPKRTLFISYGE